jgi:hypothetical protein
MQNKYLLFHTEQPLLTQIEIYVDCSQTPYKENEQLLFNSWLGLRVANLRWTVAAEMKLTIS